MKPLDIKPYAGQSRKSGVCSWTRVCRSCPYILVVISLIILCLLAFVKFAALDWIIDQQVEQKLRLIPGTDTFEKWRNVPVPIIIKFRIFNVTNPVQVQNGGIPSLIEAGPYAYEEKRVKEIIAMDNERDTIIYKQRIFYTFRPDLSKGSEFDRLVVINVPFVTLSKMTYDNVGNFSFAHALADRNMRQRGERLFTYASVKEYLFDGYSVQHYLNFLKSPALALIGGVKIPHSISTGRFGFYLGKNGSDDGEFVIRTGRTNPQEFGQIVSWNGKTRLDYYDGQCNLINGTDGSLVPPFVTKESKIRFFSTDICRSIYMVFREESEVLGVKTYRFRPPNAKKIFNQKDFCFCPKGKNNECFQYGVLSMAPCRDGAPVSMSSVHFLDAYEQYLYGVQGLQPDKEIHETFLDIEPKTGLILNAAKRVQFNVMLNPNRDMTTFAQVRKVMIPFMWVEETAEPTEAFIRELHQQLFRPMAIANTVALGGLISCVILISLGLLAIFSVRAMFCRNRHSTNSVTSDNSNSFHAERSTNTSRASSRSRSGSISSFGRVSSATSFHTNKSMGSIISVMSRGTMTTDSESKGILSEDIRTSALESGTSKLPLPNESTTCETPVGVNNVTSAKGVLKFVKPQKSNQNDQNDNK